MARRPTTDTDPGVPAAASRVRTARAEREPEYDRRRPVVHTTETRRSTATSEFYVFLITAITALFFAYESGRDTFSRDEGWRVVAALAIGYMISRGLAKVGVREPYVRDD